MKNIKVIKSIFLCFLFCLSILNISFAEKISDLKVDKYVNDYANIIDDNKEAELNNILYKYFASTTNQIVVVTVNDIDGDYIESYSIKLAEKIKAGGEKNDNGVLLLVAKDDRKMRIEVGYGLEPVLTDGESSYIINNILKPEFKNNNYTSGIENGVTEIIKVLDNSSDVNYSNYANESSDSDSKSGVSNIFYKFLSHIPIEFFFVLFFFGVSAFQWFVSVLGRTKSWWLGGVVGGVFAAVIVAIFGVAILSMIIGSVIILFGFIFDYFISKNYKEHVAGIKSGPPDWWAGGVTLGGGSSSDSDSSWSSSSSDSGFSGGGGSFGGGGSSGSW